MMETDVNDFFRSVQGTFLEFVFKTPISPSSITIETGDTIIGPANDFEKKCFSFYFLAIHPENHDGNLINKSDQIKNDMRGHTALGLVRSIIADRWQVDNQDIRKIWLDKTGQIILREGFEQ